MKWIGIFGEFLKVNIAMFLAHRGSFWLGFVGQWFSFGASFATIWLMVQKFDNIHGWKSYEVLMLYAFCLLSYSIAATFLFHSTIGLVRIVRTGEYDVFLTKPMHPLLYSIFNQLNFGYISHFTISLAIIVYCMTMSGVHVTLGKVVTVILLVISSAVIQGAILILSSSFGFILVKENQLTLLFGFTVRDFVNYPISIYSSVVQIMLTTILPYAYINFYPVQVILEKQSWGYVKYLSPLVAIVLLAVSLVVWNMNLKKYSSTGS